MNSKRNILHSGFTIVELVVVIAVIGILASITIVSYESTRNQANKSSYDATAQQVKMKLGEYYTDNNHYPLNKAATLTYLEDTGATTLKDDFTESDYQYTAYNNSSKNSCASDVATCQYYEIIVPKSTWNGGDSDNDLLVKP